MVQILDGTGGSNYAGVNSDNQLAVASVTETEQLDIAKDGDAYNLTTGTVSLTDGARTPVMYFKNNDTKDFILPAFAFAIGTLPSPTESAILFLVRNPTTGTIIDNGNVIAQNGNRNFGSSNTLVADIFKGATGETFTNGDDIAQFFITGGSRVFATIDIIIPPGNTIGFEMQLNDTTGGDVYVAMIGYLHD